MDNSILIAYAQAMFSAQRFEGRMKSLLIISGFIERSSEAEQPLTEERFQSVLCQKRTLGQALKKVLQLMDKLEIPLPPEHVLNVLGGLVEIRNFIAHNFLENHGALVNHEESVELLVAKLEWYSEAFELLLPSLDRWCDMLLSSIAADEAELKTFEEEVRKMTPALQQRQLEALKRELEHFGIPVPQAP